MLAQLIAFCEVVHKGSFRAAADGLNISPPALTLTVQKLEAQLRFQSSNR
ncbi:MAG: LysR family transcriptional regulator [Boseongicola sp. SB0664_bin_43]|uniref:LysR family transcriptional regulator n=1 Tax=Boseongicola sp. SB0664_bin_43 TaxID=2604844 RepID=A0A6B0Y3K8_9RHOB|nr:LysR family transcriptional regulator [Boseongicola sp. SB0664_bin_43]